MVAQIQVFNNVPLKLCEKRVVPFKLVDRKLICPICGNTFFRKINISDANPYTDIYCSKECRRIAKDKEFAQKISEKEFIEFISKWDIHIKIIPWRILRECTLSSSSQTFRSLTAEDLRQEILVDLFILYSKSKKTNFINLDRIGTKYIRRLCFNACYRAIKYEYEGAKDTETAIWGEDLNTNDDFINKGLDSFEGRTYSSEYTLDIYEILQEIKKLMNDVPCVELAVERTLNFHAYEARVNKKNTSKTANGQSKYLMEKYNLKNVQLVSHYAQRGIECIYFNDPERIESYIDIDNLEQKFRFNNKDLRMLGKPINELTKDEIIHYYKGERKCTVCGKYFKSKNLAVENASCSKKCKNALRREVMKKQYANGNYQRARKKYREKVKLRKLENEGIKND